MALSVISAGVDTSFSSKLNGNFRQCERFVGQDIVSSSVTATTTETILAQVTVTAGTIFDHLTIMANVGHLGQSTSTNFKIRVGTAGTTADTQIGETMAVFSSSNSLYYYAAMFAGALLSSNLIASNTNYVSITGQNSTEDSGTNVGICTSLVVLEA